jgi:hypothetical protein
MFKYAKQSRAFEDVISQIQDAILEGKLKPQTNSQANDI